MNYHKHMTANVSNCNITVSDFLYLLIENQQYVGTNTLQYLIFHVKYCSITTHRCLIHLQ